MEQNTSPPATRNPNLRAKGATKTTVNITAFKTICAAMAQKPRSKKQLHEIAGITNTTVSRWIAILAQGKNRIVYIAAWERFAERGCYTAMWALGYGMPDAVKPKALTNAQYGKRWRAKQEKLATVKTTVTSTGVLHVSGVSPESNGRFKPGHPGYPNKGSGNLP